MKANAKVSGEPIRLVFELARADHPSLYDDLIQFPKGTKRINRLRVLAYDGLIAQVAQALFAGQVAGRGTPQTFGEDATPLTNELFGPSLKE